MDLEPTDDQASLRDELRRFLAGAGRHDARRAAAEQPGAVDRGAVARARPTWACSPCPVAEDDGGVGLGWADAAIVFEELGRAAVPGPVIATRSLARRGLGVDGAVDGSTVVGVRRGRATRCWSSTSTGSTSLVVLDERRRRVVRRAAVGRRGGRRPPARPADARSRWSRSLPAGDGRRRRPGVADRLGAGAALLAAAMQVGLGAPRWTSPSRTPRSASSSDGPIGSFQAVKHLLADAAVGVEVARAAVHAAGVAIDEGADGASTAVVAAARIVAGQAAHTASEACIQVHGGMGFTWELDAHLFLKRVAGPRPGSGHAGRRGRRRGRDALIHGSARGEAGTRRRHVVRHGRAPSPARPRSAAQSWW